MNNLEVQSFDMFQETVNVTLYTEALCPDCERFIIKQLFPGYLQLGDAVNVNVIPFGNARVSMFIKIFLIIYSLVTL